MDEPDEMDGPHGASNGRVDEPMRWGGADEMDESHEAEGGWRRRAADKTSKQRAGRIRR